jgi:hypothetical protein
MSSYGLPSRIEISEEQASDFLLVIQDALDEMNKTEVEDVRLIVRKRRAISISFDKDMHPFLGFSAEFNPPSNRVMLANDNWAINKCKWWFIVKLKTKKGGRFFIQSDRALLEEAYLSK